MAALHPCSSTFLHVLLNRRFNILGWQTSYAEELLLIYLSLLLFQSISSSNFDLHCKLWPTLKRRSQKAIIHHLIHLFIISVALAYQIHGFHCLIMHDGHSSLWKKSMTSASSLVAADYFAELLYCTKVHKAVVYHHTVGIIVIGECNWGFIG